MIRKLEDSTDIATAYAAFTKVFTETRSVSYYFQDALQPRAILYPSYYSLKEDQYNVLRAASLAMSEPAIYGSSLDYLDQRPFEEHDHWEIDLVACSWTVLYDTVGPLETAFYSKRSSWGAFTAERWFTALAGPPEFLQYVDKCLDLEANLIELIDDFKWERRNDGNYYIWLPELLSRLYGPDEATRLLSAYSSCFTPPLQGQ